MFKFIEINKKDKSHIDSLFQILKKRSFNISHDGETNYENHITFVLESNYRKWFLINKNNQTIGSYYLTFDNHIGINLITDNVSDYILVIEYIISNEVPLPEIKSERNKSFLINSAPNNKIFIEAINHLKLKHIQNTYLCNI